MVSLAKLEPRTGKDDFVPMLERVHKDSKNSKLALALAHIFEGQQQHENALRYYEEIFSGAVDAEEWGESFVVLCRDVLDRKGDKAALEFVSGAQHRSPTSKIVARWENQLREERGTLRLARPKKNPA